MVIVFFPPVGIRQLTESCCDGKDQVEDGEPFVPRLEGRLTEEDLELRYKG